MYYFEQSRYFIPLFWRENGIPIYAGNKRLSRRWIVWWMPTNWIAILLLLILCPVTMLRLRFKKNEEA